MRRFCRAVAVLSVCMAVWMAIAGPADAQNAKRYDFNYSKAKRSSQLGMRVRLPTNWDAAVGTDFSLPRDVAPEGALGGTYYRNGPISPSMTTWGKVTLPSSADDGWNGPSFEARVNPAEQRARLVTTLTGNWAMGANLTANVNDTYVLAGSALGSVPSVWETRKGVRLTLRPSRTTFVARTWRTSADTLWHTSLGAEQVLTKGLTVGTSLTNPMSDDSDMRVRAGYQLNW